MSPEASARQNPVSVPPPLRYNTHSCTFTCLTCLQGPGKLEPPSSNVLGLQNNLAQKFPLFSSIFKKKNLSSLLTSFLLYLFLSLTAKKTLELLLDFVIIHLKDHKLYYSMKIFKVQS